MRNLAFFTFPFFEEKLVRSLPKRDSSNVVLPWKCALTKGMNHSMSFRLRAANTRIVLVMVFRPAACIAPAPRTS